MAFNPGLALRSSSPASSEGSLHHGGRGKKAQDDLLTKDKSFRRYAAGIERTLALFDTTLQEWADYISFLGRLLKALQSHPDGVLVVPNKLLVAKRLAQCLHPSLPSGVHQKALEVYDFIFALIGVNGLAEDLGLYLPGIASTLTFASFSVRLLFLPLIDKYVLKVPISVLRPALKALILALLPGLEEESSDEFERTLQILDKIKHEFRAAGKAEVFWQNLFLASITSAGKRQGVLAFLNKYLPDLATGSSNAVDISQHSRSESAVTAELTTPEPGLLLRCFATGLMDEQALVKRGFLDLLVTRLPLHASIFGKEVAPDDLDLLISAAVCVVLRKDMSLNRRLWAWFLGPGKSGRPRIQDTSLSTEIRASPGKQDDKGFLDSESYFQTFCARPLVRTLQAMLVPASQAPSKMSRPYRIAFSLMDRWEIGSPVVDALFLPLLRNLSSYQNAALTPVDFQDVFRSASSFFDGVESTLIWSKMLELVIPTGKKKEIILRDLDLATFIMVNFKVREEEMIMIHIPLVTLANLECLCEAEESQSHLVQLVLDTEIRIKAYEVLRMFVEMISDRAFTAPSSGVEAMESTSINTDLVNAGPVNTSAVEIEPVNGLRKIVTSFFEQNQDSVELSQVPISRAALGKHFLHFLLPLITKHIRTDSEGSMLSSLTQVLFLVLARIDTTEAFNFPTLVQELAQRLAIEAERSSLLAFDFLSSATALLVGLLMRCPRGQAHPWDGNASAVSTLVRHIWPYLSHSTPQYHFETVRLLTSLQRAAWQDDLVTSTLSSLITGTKIPSREAYTLGGDVLDRFATLWTLSRIEWVTPRDTSTGDKGPVGMPEADHSKKAMESFSSMLRQSMISLLSVLCEPQTDSCDRCRNWLQGIADLSSIFDSITTEISGVLDLTSSIFLSPAIDGLERANYAMNVLHQVVAAQSEEQWLIFCRRQDVKPVPSDAEELGDRASQSRQASIMWLSYEIISEHQNTAGREGDEQTIQLQRSALRLIRLLLTKSSSPALPAFQIEQWIIQELANPAGLRNTFFQSDLLDSLLAILTTKKTTMEFRARQHETFSGGDLTGEDGTSRSSPSTKRTNLIARDEGDEVTTEPSDQLLNCLLDGFASPLTQNLIQKWIQVLCESTHLYVSSLFRVTMRIVGAFCKQINACFSGISLQYEKTSAIEENFEFPLFCLLNGLDFVLARAHEQLLNEEEELSIAQTTDPQQGFFGSIVSSAVSSQSNQARNTANNNRLTVILCFQDALKTCSRLWSWQVIGSRGSSCNIASFRHSSQKIRARSRKILEHLVAAEPLEAVEVLTRIWVEASEEKSLVKSKTAMDLVHTLEGSRPQLTMVALFNAVVSRSNPSALDFSQKSTLSTHLQEQDLVRFIVVYTQSLEDDVLDEIWNDCTNFLRAVLGNPMPYRHILLRLIDFIAILNAKLENTNVSEEQGMRKDLRELLVRLLTAIFTIKPQSMPRDKSNGSLTAATTTSSKGLEDIEQVFDLNFSMFPSLLGDSERLISVLTSIVSNTITPVFRSRLFPRNLNSTMMSLVLRISKVPGALKAWKKDVMETFNDGRFFSCSMSVAKNGWLPLLRQLAFVEKNLVAEILFRLSSPTSAGIMFGIGATAARAEADRRAQLNLRRIASLLLALEKDTLATELLTLQSKLEDLLTASAASSPSSATRADIFMVIRAMSLVSSPSHMARFWPVLNLEFRAAFSSLSGTDEIGPPQTYNSYSILQSCKLLDVLLLTNPEDFQPQEWVFVTDTVDATYRSNDWAPTALVDEVAQSMMENDLPKSSHAAQSSELVHPISPGEDAHNLRKPWLSGPQTRSCVEKDIQDNLLRPFFGQLSIHVYERTYNLSEPDLEACRDDLLADLFNDSTVVGG